MIKIGFKLVGLQEAIIGLPLGNNHSEKNELMEGKTWHPFNNLDMFIGRKIKLVFQEPNDTRPKALTVTVASIEMGLIIFKSSRGRGCVKTDFIIAIKPLEEG